MQENITDTEISTNIKNSISSESTSSDNTSDIYCQTTLDVIMFGVATARDTAKHTRRSEHINAILSSMLKPRSRCNYAEIESAAKR